MTNREQLKQDFCTLLAAQSQKTPETATPYEQHNALSAALMAQLAPNWSKTRSAAVKKKCAHYLSAEFLVGRMVYNNLLSLGLLDDAQAVFDELGLDLSAFEEIEDMALGNGGLGRLAACFLDSAATHDIPLNGYGIRYRYGLFKQRIVNGAQAETADDWARFGDPWSVRHEDEAVLVELGGLTVRAVPYDMPVIGYGTDTVGTLRLWQAEPVQKFDFALFNAQKYEQEAEARNAAFAISAVLYPNDSTPAGKKLRLRQQYFFSSASVQDILKKYKAAHGSDFSQFAAFNAIQLNDTHPVIAIPELIRILMDDEGLSFTEAFGIAQQTFGYTNHTVMPEALECWSCAMVKDVAPRVYEIIRMINEHFLRTMADKGLRPTSATVKGMRLIAGGTVHMARLAVYATAHVNGVAWLHTELLKTTLLKDWYALYPERFTNKTNGITQRRWLRLCNRELSGEITRLLGSDGWVKNLEELGGLKRFADDTQVLTRFNDIKRVKKQQLADYVRQHDGFTLNPDFIFDIQVKRLHEYKRQLLNAFAILDIYFKLKDGTIQDFTPTAFIFGAKSAPGYDRAKGIIRFICEIARLINSDPAVNTRMQVVFVANYNVSYGEKLFPAADISEQISTAGTEASGTGNMKFMLSGAVTLGTYDGANIEIVQEAGQENNYIFGARVEEIMSIKDSYNPRAMYESDAGIKRVVDTLIDGTFSDGGTGSFKELYTSLLDGASWHKPDHYFLLHDLNAYVEAKLRVNREYNDRLAFAKKCFMNVASAAKFSSDRTIKEYAGEIWGVGK